MNLLKLIHDGHQHSDFDLCKWVQFNSGNSLALETIDISLIHVLNLLH